MVSIRLSVMVSARLLFNTNVKRQGDKSAMEETATREATQPPVTNFKLSGLQSCCRQIVANYSRRS